MRKLLTGMIALALAVIMGAFNPVRVLASDAGSQVYLSELKVGMGKKAADAEKALEGYTIITDASGQKVDFNKGAGGGLGSKGDKVVYIGYRTTTDRKYAITDVALMNMKGPYDTDSYDLLMEGYMNQQIIPFVQDFMAAIREYRENYNSSNPGNKARAQYIHDALNKFTDDDCNGAGIGDLLLNQTKFEMGDDAYNALSDEEKARHADIVTIIAQANGIATLAIENLLVRAADSSDTTWIDRLRETSVDDLLDETGLSYSKALKELDKLYYDDAMRLLQIWDTFRDQLAGYDEALATLEEATSKDFSKEKAIIENYNFETATEEEGKAYGEAIAVIEHNMELISSVYADVMCKEYLETIEYEGGTLLDLFMTPSNEFDEDPTLIYPIIASLSEGQRAGMDFLTLEDLIMIGATDENGYKESTYDEMEPESVYENVERGIYEPGGVGLTSDSIRSDPKYYAKQELSPLLSTLSYVSYGLTAASAIALGVSLRAMVSANRAITAYNASLSALTTAARQAKNSIRGLKVMIEEESVYMGADAAMNRFGKGLEAAVQRAADAETALAQAANPEYLARMSSRSSTCSKLAKGFGVAVIIMIAISTYFTWRDLVNHYKVEFTPIPRFMVDEKDITAFNANGEKIVIKNQQAYYKAALCNRDSSAEFYKVLGDVADLNGDVGKQWLALYYARNEAEQPILASSLKVVIDSKEIPAGYSEGFHMFGVGAAENINNTLYVWDSGAKSIYVYFQKASAGASTAGSLFTFGSVALTGGAGIAVGATATALAMKAVGKKKKKEEE